MEENNLIQTWVSVIPDFINELVAAAVGDSVLSSAGVRGAVPNNFKHMLQ